MPVAGQRNPEEVGVILRRWLEDVLHEERVEVTDLVVPQSSGFSNETFLFDASWSDAPGGSGRFVLRAQPVDYGLFPHIDVIAQQFETMRLLGACSDVPVPRTRWAEPTGAVLGQPFFVMDRLDGQVPPDSPPYAMDGWVMDLEAADRRTLFESGIDALARINRVDWRANGFDHLDRPEHGPTGPVQLRGYFDHYRNWALADLAHPVLEDAWAQLEAAWPDDGHRLELTWGDARPGNQMFADLACVGVFDWEMAAIANAESDLGWWNFMQRFHTEGIGVALPDGFLTRDETVLRWEQQVGRSVEHLDFYERLAAFHFCLIMVMMSKNMHRLDPDNWDAGFALNNPGITVLQSLFAS